MTTAQLRDEDPVRLTPGMRVRLPGETRIVIVGMAAPGPGGGLKMFVTEDESSGQFRQVSLTAEQLAGVSVVTTDGAAPPETVLAGLWTEWMIGAVRSAGSTALASTTLRPLPHQMAAVYGQMLTQPLLRFLLADEPGTGKTIMSGLWLREAQRKGLLKRALVVCPAHLVIKWKADFKRFFGGGMREVTAETIRQRALSVPGENLWVVSLNLAAVNPSVREALHPDNAGWDAIIFDEAHRITPTAETLHRVGKELSASVPHALFLTATPHRGDEWLFGELLHLVDPDVFPTSCEPDSGLPGRPRTAAGASASAGGASAGGTSPGSAALKPGPLHFLRRMKEELVDYDSRSLLFKEREAQNIKVPMNSQEQRCYDRAQELVADYFPVRGRGLAAMVYGKRAASSLYALSRTLRRRLDKMGTNDTLGTDHDDEDDDDGAARVETAGSLNERAERAAINEMLAAIEPYVGAGSPHSEHTIGRMRSLADTDPHAGIGPGSGQGAGSSPQSSDSTEVSKWAPMLECLSANQITPGSGRQLVVFTEYSDTAEWLVRLFADEGFTAEEYSGSLDHAERADIQARFMRGRFEVIVSTDAGNEGIDLQAAHVLVNWDVPWSLVRLEQRMGRIHRIGQKHKVSLYNLVALGTREGDAHAKLLDRLIEAANELDGKMFDSLNAIMELVRASSTEHRPGGTESKEPENLLRLFYDTDSAASSISDWPTPEEIRQARDAYYAELRAMSSQVDTDAANSALHDDHIARINPFTVEKFLDRVKSGGLLECHPAPLGGEGFYYLSAPAAQTSWQLPDALRPSNGNALVVTRADARQKTIAEGDTEVRNKAADAVMLGPSDPALAALAEALRERAAPQMHQGAALRDPNARADYTLFVFECVITEGSEGPNPRHRPRPSTSSWLIRVDSEDTARPVSWDILPNLEPAHCTVAVPLSPAVSSAAEAGAEAAAEAERGRRAELLQGWVRQLRSQIQRLPNDLTDSIPDRELRREQRRRIEETIAARINDAEAAAQVTRGEPRRIGWAHVAAAAPEDPDISADEQADSERVSMRHVTDLLESDGWRVTDVHTEGRGYDLRAVRGAEQQCVEVKGCAGSASNSGVNLTGGELHSASQLGDEYRLYVVENCSDGVGRLYGAWQNPAETFRDSFTDVPVVRLPGGKLKAARHQQGRHT